MAAGQSLGDPGQPPYPAAASSGFLTHRHTWTYFGPFTNNFRRSGPELGVEASQFQCQTQGPLETPVTMLQWCLLDVGTNRWKGDHRLYPDRF